MDKAILILDHWREQSIRDQGLICLARPVGSGTVELWQGLGTAARDWNNNRVELVNIGTDRLGTRP